MVPRMNFDIVLRSLLLSSLGRTDEVSAAVAAAVGKGALDCQRATRAGVPSTPRSSLDGVNHSYYRDLALGPSNQVRAADLERGCHRKPEGLARLPQQETGGVGIHRQMVRIVSRRARREHGTRNRNRRVGQLVKPQRVVGPVDAELNTCRFWEGVGVRTCPPWQL